MTNPQMHDVTKNYAYYRDNELFKPNPDRLREPRVQWAASWADRWQPCRHVLDVGATDGFLAELLPLSVHYEGLEANAYAIRHAMPRAAGLIQQGDATTHLYPPSRYDLLYCMEILEHVIDPGSLLRRLAPALAPKGLVVATSALGHGEAHEPGNEEHLREWTPPEFRRLFMEAGYTVLEQVVAPVYGQRMTNCIAAVNLPPWKGPTP